MDRMKDLYPTQLNFSYAQLNNETNKRIELKAIKNIVDDPDLGGELLVLFFLFLLLLLKHRLANFTSPKEMWTPGSLIFTSLVCKMELFAPWMLLFIYMLMQQHSWDSLPEPPRRRKNAAPVFLPSKLVLLEESALDSEEFSMFWMANFFLSRSSACSFHGQLFPVSCFLACIMRLAYWIWLLGKPISLLKEKGWNMVKKSYCNNFSLF